MDVFFVQLTGDTETDPRHAGGDYLYCLALKVLNIPKRTERTSWGEDDLDFLDKNCCPTIWTQKCLKKEQNEIADSKYTIWCISDPVKEILNFILKLDRPPADQYVNPASHLKFCLNLHFPDASKNFVELYLHQGRRLCAMPRGLLSLSLSQSAFFSVIMIAFEHLVQGHLFL